MESTAPKTFVFVLMPFNEEFSDIYDVGIEPACRDAGAYCERVDKQIFMENILERVYNQIAKADVVVAEMTGRNPNVFYETGYAHALNKRVILLTQNAEDIPFDLKHYPHVVYGNKIALLKSELQKRICWCIENPLNSLSSVDINLPLFIRGKAVTDNLVLEYTGASVYFTIDIQNETNKVLDANSISLAIITPEKVAFNYQPRSSIQLPDGRALYNLALPNTLFPGSWDSIEVSFNPPKNNRSMKILLRLFTELGPTDYVLDIKEISRVR